MLDSRRRDETDKANEAEKLKMHQEALHKAKQEEGLARFASGHEDAAPTEKAQFKKFESYRKDVQVPNRVMDLKVLSFLFKIFRLWLIEKQRLLFFQYMDKRSPSIFRQSKM